MNEIVSVLRLTPINVSFIYDSCFFSVCQWLYETNFIGILCTMFHFHILGVLFTFPILLLQKFMPAQQLNNCKKRPLLQVTYS